MPFGRKTTHCPCVVIVKPSTTMLSSVSLSSSTSSSCPSCGYCCYCAQSSCGQCDLCLSSSHDNGDELLSLLCDLLVSLDTTATTTTITCTRVILLAHNSKRLIIMWLRLHILLLLIWMNSMCLNYADTILFQTSVLCCRSSVCSQTTN